MHVILLLTASNVLMTVAWYWHIRGDALSKPILLVILISWGASPWPNIASRCRPTASGR